MTLDTLAYIIRIIVFSFLMFSTILFLIIYKRRQQSFFTHKEVLNYNLCGAYIVLSIIFLFYYELPELYSKKERFIKFFVNGTFLIIYSFYVYMFSLALNPTNQDSNFYLSLWVYFSYSLDFLYA